MADAEHLEDTVSARFATYRELLQMAQAHVELERKILGDYALCSPPEPRPGQAAPESGNAAKLQELSSLAAGCTRCPLSKGRTRVVFGCGSPNAKLVLVGEAPGYHEDQQGIPFVGDAGQLLTKMLAAIHLSREEVYICNVIKCRPPDNREPSPEEILSCRQWFSQQLGLLRPKLLCALGKFASQALTGISQSMWQYRGNIYHYEGIPVICTYHPAYLLRNMDDKRKAWQDLQKIRQMLDS